MKAFILILLSSFSISLMGAEGWGSDFVEAQKLAKSSNKLILLNFSGSDWCGPCMKLDKNIWQSDAFKIESKKHWILVKADFPKKKAHQLSPELTESNNLLAEKYNQDGNFPLVVLLDKNGKVLGVTAYKDVDAEQYIESLVALEKR